MPLTREFRPHRATDGIIGRMLDDSFLIAVEGAMSAGLLAAIVAAYQSEPSARLLGFINGPRPAVRVAAVSAAQARKPLDTLGCVSEG